MPIKDSLPSLRGTKQSGALYNFPDCFVPRNDASADGKRSVFSSSFFLFTKLA
ncbi:MAG: hypothetical protein LBT42_07945 [Tannerella sp.]|nr:hypothetical protein [Tannerella sp.]